MILQWSSHEHMIGTLVAYGLRGVYSVERVGPEWVLQGRGHDDLTMPGLPAEGKAFATLDSAETYANELDHVRAAEAQISGV